MSAAGVRKIAVIGAGVMGHGIAEVAAMAGYEVADFVIEAVPENLDLKKEIFSKVDKIAPPHAILATNTSSLPISEIAEATERPDKVVGMHFFNPPVVMPLVEVIRGSKTSDETVNATVDLARRLGKTPIVVARDVPGFIVNRILVRVLNNACWYVRRGKASMEEVDAAARFKLELPMGPFELMDFIGIDIMHSIIKAMWERGFVIQPCPAIEEKVKAGELGVKSGKGFYTYPAAGKFVRPQLTREMGEKVDAVELIAPAVNEAAWLLREGIAGREDIDRACELGLNYPRGVLRMADEIGIDRIVEALTRLKEETGSNEYEPDPLLKQMVQEGKLGVKAGAGFYEYPKAEERKLSTLVVRIEPPIAWVYLNRPERLNAVNVEMLNELGSVLDELEERDDVRVLIVTGKGKAFSAGADVTQFKGMTPIKAFRFSRKFQEVLNKIEYLTKPVIMAINGYALGGGIEIAMSGDIRIAAESARIGQPEINLGIMPGAGGTQRMPRLTWPSRAKMLIYTGDAIPASEALKIGLVDLVVPDDKLEEEARRLALKLAEKPPIALLAAKYAIQFGMQADIRTGLSIESALFSILFSTRDFEEGVSAFLEKRKPKFRGE